MKRVLTITTNADWKQALRSAGALAVAGVDTNEYQGETLNFESPGLFFSHLTERRWQLIREMLGNKAVGVRELARRLGRDVKRVHEDSSALVKLGILEKDEVTAALSCPYDEIHIDMLLTKLKQVA